MALADFEHGVLDDLGVGIRRQFRKLGIEIAQSVGFRLARSDGAAVSGSDEIVRIIDGEADELVELGIGLG